MSNEHSTQPAGSAETRRSSKGQWLSRVRDANAALAAAGDPRALKGSEWGVLVVVGSYANDFTLGDAWPSVDTIAAGAGVSVRMANKALARLRDAGWLRVTRLGGVKGQPRATTVYAMAYPDCAEPATSDRPNTPTPEAQFRGTPEAQFRGTSEAQFRGTPEAQFSQNGSSEVVPSKWFLGSGNASDAPPRRCTPAADATGEAIARAVSESDPESNSEHGPCATCAQSPGRVEVLCNPSGKAHLLDSLSPGQRKVYSRATVIHYCLPCARRAPLRAWWTHTPAESVA